MKAPIAIPTGPALLRLPDVLARVGLSRSDLYRRISERTFPAPLKLGPRASAWVSTDVEAWVSAKIAERDKARAA